MCWASRAREWYELKEAEHYLRLGTALSALHVTHLKGDTLPPQPSSRGPSQVTAWKSFPPEGVSEVEKRGVQGTLSVFETWLESEEKKNQNRIMLCLPKIKKKILRHTVLLFWKPPEWVTLLCKCKAADICGFKERKCSAQEWGRNHLCNRLSCIYASCCCCCSCYY